MNTVLYFVVRLLSPDGGKYLLGCLLLNLWTSGLSANPSASEVMPDTSENRYATGEDAAHWPSVNEGDYIFFQGNNDGGDKIYAPATGTHLAIELSVGNKILIYAGDYERILISGSFCQSTPEIPTIVTNLGGQVRWGNSQESNQYRTLELYNFDHLYLSGKYDAENQTGDADYLGHNGRENLDSEDYYERYGLWGNPKWSGPIYNNTYGNGVRIRSYKTAKVDYVASWGGYFASFNIKTDNPAVPGEVQLDVQDCFAGFGEGEGFYISYSTGAIGQDVTRLILRNNIVVFTGAEALQTDSLAEGSIIENNVAIGSGTFFRHPFQALYQDNLHQLSFIEGDIRIQNNVFVGTNGALHNFRHLPTEDGRAEPADDKPVILRNNYYGMSRTNLGYMWQGDGITPYVFSNNVYGGISVPVSDDTLSDDPIERAGFFNIGNSNTDILFEDNLSPAGRDLFYRTAGDGSNITRSGNVQGQAPVIQFENVGFSDEMDWRNISFWSSTYKNTPPGEGGVTKNGEFIPYRLGEIVIYYDTDGNTKFFECIKAHAGEFDPNTSFECWRQMSWSGRTLPPLDVRIRKDTVYNYRGMGLTYNKQSEDVSDLVPPEVSLIGGQANFELGTEYFDPGYMALDNRDGDITEEVEVEWIGAEYDAEKAGSYRLRYRVIDAAGNFGSDVYRAVTVSEVNVVVMGRMQLNLHRYNGAGLTDWTGVQNDAEGLRVNGDVSRTELFDVVGESTEYSLKIEDIEGGYSEHYKTHDNAVGRSIGEFPADVTKSGLRIRDPHENPCVLVFEGLDLDRAYDVWFTGYVEGAGDPLEATLYHEVSQQSSTINVRDNESEVGQLVNLIPESTGELPIGFRTGTANGLPNISGLIIEEKSGIGYRGAHPSISGDIGVLVEKGRRSTAIDFVLNDDDTDISELNIAVFSSDKEVLPVTGVEIFGSGAERQLFVTTLITGNATVTLLVDDGFNYVPFSLEVVSVPLSFLEWISDYYESELNDFGLEESVWGFDADPDGDGFSNQIEWFWKMDPSLLDVPYEIEIIPSSEFIRLQFEINEEISGLEWRPLWSSDLLNWNDENLSMEEMDTMDGRERYEITVVNEFVSRSFFFRIGIE